MSFALSPVNKEHGTLLSLWRLSGFGIIVSSVSFLCAEDMNDQGCICRMQSEVSVHILCVHLALYTHQLMMSLALSLSRSCDALWGLRLLSRFYILASWTRTWGLIFIGLLHICLHFVDVVQFAGHLFFLNLRFEGHLIIHTRTNAPAI